MRKQLITVLLLICFIGGNTYAQHKITKPNYKKIEKAINKKRSDKYYPKLFNRYQNNDTTLTDEDYTLLFYGAQSQPGYLPYGGSPYSDSTAKIFNKSSLTLADYDSAINYETICLQLKPFSLRDLNILAYSYIKTGNDSLANLINYKKERIIKTILSTGDGKTQETGFYVITATQEYDILQILNFDFSGEQTLTTNGCDYLGVKENKYHIKGLFFDVNKMMEVQNNLSK
ncbi:MAG TPA: DUF4919 domain-containing protein [Ferruginibacter sp.]|jgi:hypothetical protein|nr:DUF4919 domain-containing protein [Ferruginibacter sp.]